MGDGLAGKTSILQGWPNGCVPNLVTEEECTINISPSSALLSLDAQGHVAAPGHTCVCVSFSSWDVGRQVGYSLVQQAYLSPGALYLLVVYAAKTTDAHTDELHQWLHGLQAQAPGAVVQPINPSCRSAAWLGQQKA